MKIRLFLLVPFVLFSIMMNIIDFNFGGNGMIFFHITTLIGIYGIFSVINNHRRFKLEGDVLVIKGPFSGARTENLKEMTAWSENGFNIRAQRRKTVMLLFAGDRKVVVDNSEYATEFDELARYLETYHPEQKQ